MVFGNDEEGNDELDGDEEGRAVASDEEPGKEREAGGAEDGCQRDVTGDGGDQKEDSDGGDGA